MFAEPVKFLLVDDREENLLALEAVLRREGLGLLKARSGMEALELLLVHEVALAILDVQMPEMDGFELAELMRGTERTRGVPIIFLTAGGMDEQRRFRGYEAGGVDFLFKPFDAHVLRSKAEVFFELYRQRREVVQQRDDLRAAAEENARLLEQTRRIAETLQHSLLLAPAPDAYPGLLVNTLYQAAYDDALVGGDFYDVFAVSEDSVALVVGDNTGKGIESATYTAEIKFALRMALRIEASAARALKRLNDFIILNQRHDAGHFDISYVALSLAIVNTRTGEAVCTSAGAEPPLLLRADTREVEEIAAFGPLLGMSEASTYTERQVTLSEGDMLALVTDGITEARRPRSVRRNADFFGLDGLAQSLKDLAETTENGLSKNSLSDIGSDVMRRVKEWTGGGLQDDVCLVLARRTAAGITGSLTKDVNAGCDVVEQTARKQDQRLDVPVQSRSIPENMGWIRQGDPHSDNQGSATRYLSPPA